METDDYRNGIYRILLVTGLSTVNETEFAIAIAARRLYWMNLVWIKLNNLVCWSLNY